MDTLVGIIPVYLLVLSLPVMFALHEFEEWNILRWYKKHYTGIPESTDRSIRVWIIFISILIFGVSGIALLFVENRIIFSILMVALSAFMITNIIQHVIWTIQYRDYSVGLITAGILLGVVVFVNISLFNAGLINAWFYVLSGYILIPVIKTVKSPHVMTQEIRGIHNIGIKLDTLLFSRKR